MADEPASNVPPVTPKQKKIERLDRWQKADTGGDPYDRSRGQYSKNPPARPEDYDF